MLPFVIKAQIHVRGTEGAFKAILYIYFYSIFTEKALFVILGLSSLSYKTMK